MIDPLNYDEFHDLPDNGNKQSCWMTVKKINNKKIIQYHYSVQGCYHIEMEIEYENRNDT